MSNLRRRSNIPAFLFVSITIIVFYYLVNIGYRNFTSLEAYDLSTNLRWLNSALIQVYGGILAISPAISLALVSLSSSKYPLGLARKILRLPEIWLFLAIMITCILVCTSILVSQGSITDETISGPWCFWADVFTIAMAILAIIILLEGVGKLISIEFVLKDFKRRIRTDDEDTWKETYEEYHTLLYQIAVSRNLVELRACVENLYEMAIFNDRIYDNVTRTIHDIERIYRPNNEISALSVLDRSVEKGKAAIAGSDNINLINRVADHMTRPLSESRKDGGREGPISFYWKHIKNGKWEREMDHERIMRIVKKIIEIECQPAERKDLEPCEVSFFVNIMSFLFDSCEDIESSSRFQFAEKYVSKYLCTILEGFKEVEIEGIESEDREKLEEVTDRILDLKEYFEGKSATFNGLLLMLKQFSGIEGTLIHYLYKKLE
jgi:hypothetical protein